MLKRWIPAVGAAALMVCSVGYAQNDSATNRQQSGSTDSSQSQEQSSSGRHQAVHEEMSLLRDANSPDKLFVVGQLIDNQAEIELAQTARSKAENQQVKQVAQQILQDHQQMAQQLSQVAQQENLQVPQQLTLPPMKQQEKKVLESLSGQQFDQHFISLMKASHAACVSKFEDVSRTAQDGAVKQFASAGLPVLQRHFQAINTAAAAVGLSSAEATPAGATIRGSGATNDSSTGTTGSGSNR